MAEPAFASGGAASQCSGSQPGSGRRRGGASAGRWLCGTGCRHGGCDHARRRAPSAVPGRRTMAPRGGDADVTKELFPTQTGSGSAAVPGSPALALTRDRAGTVHIYVTTRPVHPSQQVAALRIGRCRRDVADAGGGGPWTETLVRLGASFSVATTVCGTGGA